MASLSWWRLSTTNSSSQRFLGWGNESTGFMCRITCHFSFLYQVPVLVINSKTQLQINSAISFHSGPFCVLWDLYLFKLLLHCCICMWTFCRHVSLYTTYMPDACSDQNKVSDFLELALQMVLSYCLGAGNWPWSSGRAVSVLHHYAIFPVLGSIS